MPETAAYLEAVAHAEQLLDGTTNDAATADAAMTEAVTAVEDAWKKMVNAALKAEQPWPVVIEKTPLEDALTRADDAEESMQMAIMRRLANSRAQSIQQAITRRSADTDQQQL